MIDTTILDNLDRHKVDDCLIAILRLRRNYPKIEDDKIIEAFERWHHKE